MTDFEIDAIHKCGHTERITGSTTGGVESIRAFHAQRLCSFCKPTCAYCRRTGLRENMVENGLVGDGLVYCNSWCQDQKANPTHYREWTSIAIPAFLAHWQDHSYHNDACARSEYEMGAHALVIWVEHDKPEDRDDPSCAKYCVTFNPNSEDSEGDPLYQGDDASEASEWASAAEIVVCGPDSDDAPGATAKAETLRQIVAKANAK